jgi:glycosyltransferase involved in cell wall biosynthesis
MHVAWLGKKSPPCGNVTYSREITNALLDRGYRVSFLHFAEEQDRFAAPEEVPLPYLYKSQAYTIPTLRANKVLVESLEALRPDVVHASLTLSPLDFLLPEICADLKIPLVATFHAPFDDKHRNLSARTQEFLYSLYAPSLANYDYVIVFSYSQRDFLARLGVPEERLAVIPNGVDVLKYSPGPSKVKAEFNADFLFLYQGRIAIEKNVEALLWAWRQAKMPPRSKLLMVGSGALMTSLMSTYGPEHNILWLGSITDEQRRIEILRGADVFILPSFVEGLSLSLLEAMSCGVACLATDVGADGEVVQGAGVVLSLKRIKSELCTLLPLLCDFPEMISMLGQKARSRALERYSLTRNIDALEKFYAQVLNKPGAGFLASSRP